MDKFNDMEFKDFQLRFLNQTEVREGTKDIYWKCFKCHSFCTSHLCFMNIIVDAGCPVCGNSFGNFTPIKMRKRKRDD